MAPLCQGLLTQAFTGDESSAHRLTGIFLGEGGRCQTHADAYLKQYEAVRETAKRPSLAPIAPNMPGVCRLPQLPAESRRRIVELLAAMADPRNALAAERTSGLGALCACDRARARPLVRKARNSTSQDERAVARSGACQ